MTITCPQLGNAGRLGNQLFQIAATIGVAAERGEDFKFHRWAYEPYFSVLPEWFQDVEPIGTDVTSLVGNHIDERAKVYLQDYNLWSKVKAGVKLALAPSDRALGVVYADHSAFLKLPRPKLALHVRRGDNATAHLRGEDGNHPLRPMSYYRDAIKMLAGYNSAVIFSDDIPWCKENFSDLDVHFFEGGAARPKEHEPEYKTAPVEDWLDLVAMSTCDKFIMSNSTYSWWGAFLSHAEGKDIIAPSPWFGPKLSYIDASLMMPPDWTVLNHAS